MNTIAMHNQEDLFQICEMSVRYHSHRLRFLTGVHRMMMFFVALAGTAIFAKIHVVLLQQYLSYQWLGAATSIIVLVELVFDIQGARSLYQNLYRRFTSFAGEIASTPNADEETIRRWNRHLHDLYADEPPVYRVLNAHVHNELAIRLGKREKVRPIKWYLLCLKNFFSFPTYDPTKGEEANND